MSATRASRTRWASVIVATLVVLSLPLVAAKAYFAFRGESKPQPPSSFDHPIGKLDARKVPNGWAPYIEAAATESGVPAPVLAAQLQVESGWDPRAESPVGAQGLAQFMPDTWKIYGRGGDPFEPKDAIAAQGRYMKYLLQQSRASGYARHPYELALAGYNAGFGEVRHFEDVPPYAETENYVATIRDNTFSFALPVPKPSTPGTGSGSATALDGREAKER